MEAKGDEKNNKILFPKKVTGKKSGRKLLIAIYAVYLIIILISATAYYAEQSIYTRSNGTHSYSIKFENDGNIEHYTVKRIDKSEPGRIWVEYDSNKHELDVKTQNILELEIDSRSIAQEKSQEILGHSYEGYENEYKQYFLEKNLFKITVETDNRISLTFKEVPLPYKVYLNGDDFDFTYGDGGLTTSVPEGSSNVEIYFTSDDTDLIAHFETDNKLLFFIPDATINFDASKSSPKEKIVDYLWDFGDGAYADGIKVTHKYTEPGQYKVVLVVRGNDGKINRGYGKILVFDTDNDDLPDDWERWYFQTLEETAAGDPDNDDLTNIDEYKYDTNPKDPDSDFDSFKDGLEVEKGTDPLDPLSVPEQKETEDDELDYVTYIIIPIIIIIILIALAIAIRRSRASKAREEELSEKELEAEEYEKYDEGELEEEPYECPECGSVIEEDQNQCFECGAILEWEDDEGEEGALDVEGEVDEFESDISDNVPIKGPPGIGTLDSTRGTIGLMDTESMLKGEDQQYKVKVPVGKIMPKKDRVEDLEDLEVGDEEYECPTCGAAVSENDLVCPHCGEEFE